MDDLHRLTNDQDIDVRKAAASAIGSAFPYVPDKKQAWNELYELATDRYNDVRFRASYVLGNVFSCVPNKQQIWDDLYRLATNEEMDVRETVTSAICFAFPYVPDKQKAWNDLHKLTNDKSLSLRYMVTSVIGSVFPHLPDKKQAWNYLHKLTIDKDYDLRIEAASAIGSAFPYVPDKKQAWDDLHRLTNDKSLLVRDMVTSVIGSVFPHLPDKKQAWNYLHKLTIDKDYDLRIEAASAIGSAFPYVPDKKQAWNDLRRLAIDNRKVRIHSNHSLGKISIFRASQAENEKDYRKELERAIEFFERAIQDSGLLEYSRPESRRNNPANFCLPFYRSFHTIIFKKQKSKEEIDKYLAEAKAAVKGSKVKGSKNEKLLFEAVENLANALKEVQNRGNLDLEAKKDELNFYRQYCDRAAELMRDTEETAPFATEVLRKGLPMLDRNLKELLKEIQKKTELISEQTKGTQLEKLGDELTQSSQFLLQVRDPVGLKKEVDCMQNIIRSMCSKFPEDQKSEAFELLKTLYKEPSIEDKIPLINNILSKLSYQLDMTTLLTTRFNGVETKLDLVETKLDLVETKLDFLQKGLIRGLEKLEILSLEVGGKEGELIQTFSKKILELTEKEDKEALQNFLEEVLKNEDTLTREIESSSASHQEKKEAKESISNLKSLLKKVKNPAKEFGKDVANEIVVSYTAKGIIELFLPIMSMAVFGVPIPSQIIDILTNVITEIKN